MALRWKLFPGLHCRPQKGSNLFAICQKKKPGQIAPLKGEISTILLGQRSRHSCTSPQDLGVSMTCMGIRWQEFIPGKIHLTALCLAIMGISLDSGLTLWKAIGMQMKSAYA